MKFVNIYWKTSQNSLETESQTDNDLEITKASKFLQILEKIQNLCDSSQKQNVYSPSRQTNIIVGVLYTG